MRLISEVRQQAGHAKVAFITKAGNLPALLLASMVEVVFAGRCEVSPSALCRPLARGLALSWVHFGRESWACAM